MKNIHTIILLLIPTLVLCQAPDIEWEVSLGNNFTDGAESVRQTLDGGYIVAGVTQIEQTDDYYIIKLTASGEIEWEKTYGGSAQDYAYSIDQTSDGGYIVAGISYSSDGDVSVNYGAADYWVIKLDSFGELIWEKSFGGTQADKAFSIQSTSEGGYIIAGQSNSTDVDVTGNHGSADYWIIKLDSMGELLWQKSLGGDANDYAYSIDQTSDGGYIVAGISYSSDGDVSVNYGSNDCWVVRLDSQGNLVWEKSFGSVGSQSGDEVRQTADGGFLVVGINNVLYWILKIDSSGNLLWEQSYGGSGSDIPQSIATTTDGGCLVIGVSTSTDGDVSVNYGSIDYWVIKLDSFGELIWEKSLGGTEADYAYSIFETNNEGIVIAGRSYSNDGDVSVNNGASDAWVVRLEGCNSTTSSIVVSSCDVYTAPDGEEYTSTGNYTSVIPNFAGCDSVISIELTINITNALITQLDDITLQAEPSNAEYQWVDCNNNNEAVNGATNQTFLATYNSSFGVVVTLNGCSDLSDCIDINKVGLSELTTSKNLIQILDLMGRETPFKPNTPLIYVYDDGSIEKVFTIE